MRAEPKNLGKLIAVHGLAPAYVQRAIFITVLSFVFFLAMMIAYYMRAEIGYFLLASAFLLIYLVMMFSWVRQRRNVVEVFERGFRYRNDEVLWREIESVSPDGAIRRNGQKEIALARSLNDFGGLIAAVRGGVSQVDHLV